MATAVPAPAAPVGPPDQPAASPPSSAATAGPNDSPSTAAGSAGGPARCAAEPRPAGPRSPRRRRRSAVPASRPRPARQVPGAAPEAAVSGAGTSPPSPEQRDDQAEQLGGVDLVADGLLGAGPVGQDLPVARRPARASARAATARPAPAPGTAAPRWPARPARRPGGCSPSCTASGPASSGARSPRAAARSGEPLRGQSRGVAQPLHGQRHRDRPHAGLERAAPADPDARRVLLDPVVELVQRRVGVGLARRSSSHAWASHGRCCSRFSSQIHLGSPRCVRWSIRGRRRRPPGAGDRVEPPVDGVGQRHLGVPEVPEPPLRDAVGRRGHRRGLGRQGRGELGRELLVEQRPGRPAPVRNRW